MKLHYIIKHTTRKLFLVFSPNACCLWILLFAEFVNNGK